jgi:hypothetical protein
MTDHRDADSGASPQRPLDRGEARQLAVVAILGVLWGIAWKRGAALSDIASLAPAMLVVIGPVLLAVYLGLRVATGRFQVRITGFGAAIAVAAALVANLAAPGLSPSVDVSGRLSGTLDGTPLDGAATCTWGPGRAAVIRVSTVLPALITTTQGDTYFTKNVPTGTLALELPAGSIALTDIPAGFSLAQLPLRNGSGNEGAGDRSTGSVVLDTTQAAVVNGQLSWACDPAPAP